MADLRKDLEAAKSDLVVHEDGGISLPLIQEEVACESISKKEEEEATWWEALRVSAFTRLEESQFEKSNSSLQSSSILFYWQKVFADNLGLVNQYMVMGFFYFKPEFI